jgi:hypothetical protein
MAPPALAAAARPVLQRLAPAHVGGGTIGNFAELNRNRPPPGALDVLAYPVCPQIHATDDLSLIENLEALGDAVATARAFAAGAAVAVGPVRFHRHPDPFAGGDAGEGREAVRPDPRQAAPLGAAWTLAAIARLAEAGADSVTLYNAIGPFGVMDDSGAFPAYHILAALADVAGAEVIRTEVNEPLRVAALGLRREDGKHQLLLANLTPERQVVHLEGLTAGVGLLPLGTAGREGGSLRLDLGPWEIARFEEGGGP